MRISRRVSVPALFIVTLFAFVSCGTPRPPLPPSLELPLPVTDLHAFRKADQVTLIWTVPIKTTDGTKIHDYGPTLICRSLEVAPNRCAQVGVIPESELPRPKPTPATQNPPKGKQTSGLIPAQATFIDSLPHELEDKFPISVATYAVETQNDRLRSAGLSNQVQVPLLPTLSPPEAPTAKVTNEGVVLTWPAVFPDEQVPGITYSYKLYRREHAGGAAAAVGQIPLSISAQPEFVDSGLQWQKTFDYWITIVSVLSSGAQIEGDDSSKVTIFANDVFPPATPSGLQAVTSGVGQQPFVDLTWAPNTEADLAGYNVYRRVNDQPWLKINKDPVKTEAFRDSDVQRGAGYSYEVSAVDLRGNESEKSEATNETVP